MRSVLETRYRSELHDRLSRVRPDSDRRWGRMSSHQMVCHLGDTYRASLGERPTTPNGGPLAHTLVKLIALRAPFPWPKGVKSSPELDQEAGGTRASDFATDLDDLRALVERWPAHELPSWPAHPYFGPLTRSEWGVFHFRHVDHHLRQFGA